MKKIILSILAVIGIGFVFLGYRVYVALSFFSQTKEMSSIEYQGRTTVRYDDNNFPNDFKSFAPNDNNIENISKLEKLFPSKEGLYNLEKINQLVIPANAFFPSKYVYNFKNIVPVIKNRMKVVKKTIPPSMEESGSFPSNPSYKLLRATARYWFIMSRLLEKQQDYETSLYLSLASLYLVRDFQTNYLCSGALITKMIGVAISEIACDSIFIWASKPKPQCKDISKEIAKDVLDLVKAEYPHSRYIEFEYFMFDDIIKFYEKKGSDMYARLRKSSDYKYLLDILYKEPMKYYDKPIYEINKKMEDISKIRNKLFEPQTFDYICYFMFKPERLVSITLLSMVAPNFEKSKSEYEKCLAKMEMAAIALVINSYVCENKKYPESMEELSKWFGSELPKDRLTNTPYELDFKGKHVLYNKYYNKSSGKEDEFYFDFSMN